MKLPLSTTALAAVANTSSRQRWAFVCESRRHDAHVLEAHISYDVARRRARQVHGCMRTGLVAEGHAVIVTKRRAPTIMKVREWLEKRQQPGCGCEAVMSDVELDAAAKYLRATGWHPNDGAELAVKLLSLQSSALD